jgi:hypothetical protein
MNTTTNTFTSEEAQQSADGFRKEAIMEIKYLIDDLTTAMRMMENNQTYAMSHNAELRLKQAYAAATKAELMNRLVSHLQSK